MSFEFQYATSLLPEYLVHFALCECGEISERALSLSCCPAWQNVGWHVWLRGVAKLYYYECLLSLYSILQRIKN